jgi:hypothetical protein
MLNLMRCNVFCLLPVFFFVVKMMFIREGVHFNRERRRHLQPFLKMAQLPIEKSISYCQKVQH